MRLRFIVPLLSFAVALGGPLSAQQEASNFQAISEYELVVNGALDMEARMFQSEQLRAVLVSSDHLETPVLLSPGAGSVQAVPLLRLVVRSDTNVGLLRGDALQTIGRFSAGADGINFTYNADRALLRARQPLVGETTMAALFEHSPDYRLRADSYSPDTALVARLNGVSAGYRVRVVFGSWCHVCSNFLPRGLKLQEALASSNIEFEYYGLPANPWKPPHPEVKRLDVKSLPTAIVYQGDREIGRYAGGEEWQRPEAKLWSAIESTR